MKTNFLMATICGLLCALPALAAPHDERFPISVEALDARRAEVFAATDTNGDGLVSAEEFATHEPPNREREHYGKGRHPRGHRDLDAAAGEHKAFDRQTFDAAIFTALDTDGDGVLSDTEFSSTAMATARRDLRKARMFERLDQNEDGYLTPEEFPPRRMAALDADHDGEITRDEMVREHEVRRHHRTDAD